MTSYLSSVYLNWKLCKAAYYSIILYIISSFTHFAPFEDSLKLGFSGDKDHGRLTIVGLVKLDQFTFSTSHLCLVEWKRGED